MYARCEVRVFSEAGSQGSRNGPSSGGGSSLPTQANAIHDLLRLFAGVRSPCIVESPSKSAQLQYELK